MADTALPESASQSALLSSLMIWAHDNPIIAQIIAILLLYVQALVLNQMVRSYGIDDQVGKLPGLLFLLITSCFRDFHTLSPYIIANSFIIIALLQAFETYKRKSCYPNIFNIGFWLGIAALCHFPYIAFAVAGFMSLVILRAPKAQEWLTYLSGLLLPFFFAGVVRFWNDDLSGLGNITTFTMPQWLAFLDEPSIVIYIILGFFAAAILISLVSFGIYNNRKVIGAQKFISILYWFLLAGGLSLLMQRGIHIDHLLVTTIPLGLFLGMSFAHMNRQVAEFVHVIILLGIYAIYFVLQGAP